MAGWMLTVVLAALLSLASHASPQELLSLSWRQPTGSGSPLGTGRGPAPAPGAAPGAGAAPAAANDVEEHYTGPPRNLTVGLLVPHTNFGVREYIRAVNQAVGGLSRSRAMTRKFDFMKKYNFTQANVHSAFMTLTPAPKGKPHVTSDQNAACCTKMHGCLAFSLDCFCFVCSEGCLSSCSL